LTIMDETALMYRVKFFETTHREYLDKRKVRKAEAESAFGKASKRGQMLPLDKMTISNK
jgi:hypothetical protein